MKENDSKQVAKVIDINAEAQNDMMASLIESVLPMIQPLIKPATKKFTEFMTDGNVIIIRAVKGQVIAFHIKTSDIEDIKLKGAPAGTYNMEELVEKILSGNFSI
jgi:hypothetical protein